MSRLHEGKYVDDGPVEPPTRADYLNKVVTFEQYYRAIAKDAGVAFHPGSFLDRVKRALARGDEHLTSVPLAEWDSFSRGARQATAPAFKRHGDFWSLAGGVCVAKQAARDAAEKDV